MARPRRISTWAAVDAALRATLIAMLAHVLRAGRDDPRFRTKGIGSRAAILVPSVSLVVPAVWLRSRGRPYPFGMDDLLLSIIWLDLAGNVLDLYDSYLHFDLIPHAHGTGALTVLLAWLFRMSMWRAAALATAGHVLLEGQEWASDILFGYRNVRGWWDTAGDLAAGAVGTTLYGTAFYWVVRRAGREPASPLCGRR